MIQHVMNVNEHVLVTMGTSRSERHILTALFLSRHTEFCNTSSKWLKPCGLSILTISIPSSSAAFPPKEMVSS